MNIIIKHTLKNIFKNPFRSFVLIICVMVTCITAYLTLDMSGSIENMFIAFTADMLGNVDLEIDSTRNIDPAVFENVPACDVVFIAGTSNTIATRDPKQYSYEYVQELSILGLDLEAAGRMAFFKEKFTLENNEVAISESYARTFDYVPGDVISLLDVNGERHDFTVKVILEESGVFIEKNQYSAVVTLDDIKMLLDKEELKYHSFLVDVIDDKQIDTVCDYFEENHPDYSVIRVKGSDDIKQAVNQMVAIFAILFVVTFLMVIFVTISLSEKIVNERMAVIGTLRSLGISRELTTALLLIENATYGILGFAFGTLIYLPIREPFFSVLFTTSEGSIPVQPMQTWIYFVVLAGAILVECMAPVVELTKAVKVAIRDIIFSNKDTDYKFSTKKTIGGFILLALSIVLALINHGVAIIISIVIVVVAVTMIMPEFFRRVSELLSKLFVKVDMPIAELAAKEMGTKKSTISNSILCVTISALAIALLATANGLFAISDAENYDADIIGIGMARDDSDYKYLKELDGVEDIIYMQNTVDRLTINGEEQRGTWDIYGLPTSDMFIALPDLPESLTNEECVMCTMQANKLGIKPGDTIEIVFKGEYLFPITKQMTVVSLTDSSLYESVPLLVISEDLYADIFHKEIGPILIRCQDVEAVREVINKHSLDQTYHFYTREEFQAEMAEEKGGISAAVTAAIVIGVILSIIGISGNQALGFEARRREYAVIYSTSMTRKQINKLIFQETLLSMGISVITGTVLGFVLSLFIRKATHAFSIPLPVELKLVQYLMMAVVLIVVMTLTCLQPIKLLRKMKIAEELKYE